MLSPTVIFTTSLLALGVIAAPAPAPAPVPEAAKFTLAEVYERSGTPCMTRAEAEKVAQNFQDLQDEAFNITLAKEAVSPVFIDYNDSINTLINSGCPLGPKPLGSPTFATRKEYFMAAMNQAPTPYETLKIWNTCDTVIVRWRAVAPYQNGSPVLNGSAVLPQEDVTGIVVIEVVPNPASSDQPWQFATIYSEFNSFAWGYDLGLWTSPLCAADGTPLPPPAGAPAKRSLW